MLYRGRTSDTVIPTRARMEQFIRWPVSRDQVVTSRDPHESQPVRALVGPSGLRSVTISRPVANDPARGASGRHSGVDRELPVRTDDMRNRGSWRFLRVWAPLKARYGAAEDHLAAQIARIVKTQRSAVHTVSA